MALIKQLYRDLKLTEVYEAQEKVTNGELGEACCFISPPQASYDKIVKMIEDNASVIPPSVFRPILEKVHLHVVSFHGLKNLLSCPDRSTSAKSKNQPILRVVCNTKC